MNNLPVSAFNIGVNNEIYDIVEFPLRVRLLQAMQEGSSRYPIYRTFHFSVEGGLDSIFDDLALNIGFSSQRLHFESLILDSESTLIIARGSSKKKYCSCFFDVWTRSPDEAEVARQAILSSVGNRRITAPMFTIKWQSISSHGELSSVNLEEKVDDILLDQAYPEIKGGVNNFISRYLQSEESVLVLYGPPGTGKTRLIRAILGEISRRKGENAKVIYTGDAKTMSSDLIFIKFITGSDDAFVVEDADYLMQPRSDGNEDLHRFLTMADGVARSQGRKIIFSTNLPNLRDIDDALIRPGRCFAQLHVRNLSLEEANMMLHELCHHRSINPALAKAKIESKSNNTYSLAEVYKAVNHFDDVNIA